MPEMASKIGQFGGAIVSAIVLVTFCTIVVLVVTHALPSGSENIANILLGTLSAMASQVVAYWVGSSSDSTRKTEMINSSIPAGMVTSIKGDGKP